jgi:hypothetical protein
MNITLTPEQLETVLSQARAEIVQHILTECRDRITLISRSQAAGLLNVEPRTMDAMGIPRVSLCVGKRIGYRLSDIVSYIEANLER